MFYWLFTEGRSLALIAILPLTCLALAFPIVYAVTAGVGVRRTDEEVSIQRGRLLRVLAHLAWSAAFCMIFILTLGETAVQRGRNTISQLLLRLLVGAPTNMDAQRILWFGISMTGVILVANLLLSGQLKPGSADRKSTRLNSSH